MSFGGDANSEVQSKNCDPRLETFDHVVVLMLENRSFDNLLGFLYPDGVPKGAPLGQSFAGITEDTWNPVPEGKWPPPPDGSGRAYVSKTGDYHQPYPDPGEEYWHVNRQLFNVLDGGEKLPPYNLPTTRPLPPPNMQGFVADYIEKLGEQVSKIDGEPNFEQYRQIMQCFDPDAVPVLAKLAKEFAVFDHWFCAVPSQTWCNRAFWHAGTSWGRVTNVPMHVWFEYNQGQTIFNQISNSKSGLNWKVYHDTPVVSATNVIHFRALLGHELHFHSMDHFFEDCASGNLPSYSFLEPNFVFQHNDYHPSSAGHDFFTHETRDGTVLLGEQLVAKVYDAVKASKGKPGTDGAEGNTSQNTLLVITFDEHGGCFDHVQPIMNIEPPDLDGYDLQMDFTFDRSGIRVPTIMVSAHIAKNTVVNTPMLHTSFLDTMQEKWSAVAPGAFPPLTSRQTSASKFTEVFTSAEPRPACDWPEVAPPPCVGVEPDWSVDDTPLDDLGQSIIGGAAEMLKASGVECDADWVVTKADAHRFLKELEPIWNERKNLSRQ